MSGAHPAELPIKAVSTSHHYANALAAKLDLLQQKPRLSPSSPHQDATAALTHPLTAEGPW